MDINSKHKAYKINKIQTKKTFKAKKHFKFKALICIFACLFLIITSTFCLKTLNVKDSDQVVKVNANVVEKDQTINVTYNDKTMQFNDEIDAKYAILLDVNNNTVIAEKDSNARIYPASMTKIMTLIVACENIKNFDDKFKMTYEILNPLYHAQATVAGFSVDEEVPINDLLYGAILPSGADCTIALADYISGSEEKFAELMNKKAQDLGLKDTHFTNSSGLQDENHYTTTKEMAIILEYAMRNDLCKKILSTYQYTTSKTPQHPDGILLTSTMFSRMYGTEPGTATVIAGKTGYTNESKQCLASFAKSNSSDEQYILITAYGNNKWKTIHDCINTYAKYVK